MKSIKNRQGFSLLELVIVMAVLMILGTALFFWIDPVEQVGKAKDKRRQQDILNIANAFADYSRDHKGALPILGQVDTNKKVLCTNQSGAQLTCGASTQYCLKIDDQEFFAKYLGKLPLDPDKTSDQDTGYYILRDANNNLTFGSCSYSVAEVYYKPALRATCDAYGSSYCWYDSESLASCNTICAINNLTCVSLSQAIDNLCLIADAGSADYNCVEGCGAGASGDAPIWADDNSCAYQVGTLDCSDPNSGYAVCPCQ